MYSEWIDSSTGITDDNYFYVASKYWIGIAEDTQFQSSNQYGVNYSWGTYCSAPGNCSDSYVSDTSALTKIPRSYNHEDFRGALFNWFSATAESGDYSATNLLASDSLCPAGWQLPAHSISADNQISHEALLNSYELAQNATSAQFVRKMPMSFVASQFYQTRTGALDTDGTGTHYWSYEKRNESSIYNLYSDITYNRLLPTNSNYPAIGSSIRCIRKK